MVEFVGTERELDAKIKDLKAHLARLGFHGAVTIAETPARQDDVWTVRKAGLGLMMSERSEAKPVSFIEDGAVPVESLADYISDVERIIYDNDTTYAIYAHASAGCLHIRPLINLKTLKRARSNTARSPMRWRRRSRSIRAHHRRARSRHWRAANSANTSSVPS